MYPTRATEAGRHDRDAAIEDFSAERVSAWLEFNRAIRASLAKPLSIASPDDRLDALVLKGQIDRELLDHDLPATPRSRPAVLDGAAVERHGLPARPR
jgi:hypothetical protein